MKALREIGITKAFRFVWYSFYAILLRWSFFPQFRVILMRLAGSKVGKDTIIMDARFINLYHYGLSRLTCGKRCFVGDDTLLDLRGKIIMEDNVTVSAGCKIVTHINVGYRKHPLQKYLPCKEEQVVLKRGCYIGTGAIILPGVTIGAESVVGAGAVVTKNVAVGKIVAGVPAKIIRSLK